MTRNFGELLNGRWKEGALCIGLDVDRKKIPAGIAPFIFLKLIVEATKQYAAAYKPNLGFFLADGIQGLQLLVDIIDHIKLVAPGVPIILDMKTADIGNTSKAYAEFAFDQCRVDAVTVNPYLGQDGIQPFLDRKDKGIFVLCRTSNPDAADVQHLDLVSGGNLLFHAVATMVEKRWNQNGNCGLVVGATAPDELEKIREIAPNLPILIPGIGNQGGDLAAAVHNGQTADGNGFLVNVSRGILFPGATKDWDRDFAAIAARLALGYREDINKFRSNFAG